MADQAATENWQRYEYAQARGHQDYCKAARRCERFYLGGGLQWDKDVADQLASDGRIVSEINEILPAVNTALGHQINNRMDIAFIPRAGAADQKKAEIFTKVVKQIADNNKLHWLETQVYGDGLIQQRGYFDVRVDFSENVFGEIKVATLDPMDVIPDPDAKDYDPDKWNDVTVARWMTLDDIEQTYGKEARRKVENARENTGDFGDETEGEGRSKFGGKLSGMLHEAAFGQQGIERRRVIDRQFFRYTMAKVAVYPSGDIRPLPDDTTPEKTAELAAEGVFVMRRMIRRVRWVVSTWDTVLMDEWSPYQSFSVVPYFSIFRRGQTRGMVDNAISPQEVLNKAVSQFIHIVNSSANSGYTVEQNSLTNMTTEDLEANGAKNGLVIEYKEGAKPPQKIQPNPVPSGIDRLIDRATMNIKETTGVSDAMQGLNGAEVSGIAIQSKQNMGQQQLAVSLDNLARTRNLLASRLRDLVQQFYDTERVFRIVSEDPLQGQQTEEIAINQFDPMTGQYLNDLTTGEYDVVISEQTITPSWENGQFQQALEMRKAGINIPESTVLRYSNLADKQEIAKSMSQQQANPEVEAQLKLVAAQTEKTLAEATNKSIEGMFSATQAALNIAQAPAVAPLADTLLKSAGFQDKDAAPIVPNVPPGMAGMEETPPPDANTNPLTPANPDAGMMQGIEGGIEA